MSRYSRTVLVVSVLVVLAAACSARSTRATRRPVDASGLDLETSSDLGGDVDLGADDLGAGVDSGALDLGARPDLGGDLGGSADLGPSDLGPSDLGPRDLGPVDLGPSDLGVRDAGPISGVTVAFPAVGDTWSRTGEHLWEAGSYVQGVRTVALASIGRASIAGTLEGNTLTCDGQDMRLVVDGRVAGTFTIRGGDTTVALDLTFLSAPVTAGTVTLRYENAREVASGCGSARFDKTLSTLTLAP